MGTLVNRVKKRFGWTQRPKPAYRTVFIGASRQLPQNGTTVVTAGLNRQESVIWSQERDNSHTQQKFPTNIIKSSKYTVFNFLPKNLFEQFRRIANFYFLCMAVVQLTVTSPVEPITSVFPLVFVIGITMLKQGYEDYLRHVADRQVNNRTVFRLSHLGRLEKVRSKELRVGDIIYTPCDHKFPCDSVLLASSEPDAKAQVQTANLDGETSLKVIKAPAIPELQIAPGAFDELDSEQLANKLKVFRARLECEQPTSDLYQFRGNIHCDDNNCASDSDKRIIPVSEKHLLLGGARLKNTGFTFSAAVYTGEDSKMALNSIYQANKFSALERTMNRFLLCCFVILAVEVLLATISKIIFISLYPTGTSAWYFLDGKRTFYNSSIYADSNSYDNAKPRSLAGQIQLGLSSPPLLHSVLNTSNTGVIGAFGSNTVVSSQRVSFTGQMRPATTLEIIGRVVENLLAFVILFNVIIPISLYVTVECQRFLGSRFIQWDVELYDGQRDLPAKVNSSDLNEALGQVEYLFTDKTGTLTENDMRFRKCTIRGIKYEEKRSSGFLIREKPNRSGAAAEPIGQQSNSNDSPFGSQNSLLTVGLRNSSSNGTGSAATPTSLHDNSLAHSTSFPAISAQHRAQRRRGVAVAHETSAASSETDGDLSDNNSTGFAYKNSTYYADNNNKYNNDDTDDLASVDELDERDDDDPPRNPVETNNNNNFNMTTRHRSNTGLSRKKQQRLEDQQYAKNASSRRKSSAALLDLSSVDIFNAMRQDKDFELFVLALVLCHSLYVSRKNDPNRKPDDEEAATKEKKNSLAMVVAQLPVQTLRKANEYVTGDKNPIKRLVLGKIDEQHEHEPPQHGDENGDVVAVDVGNILENKKRVQQEVNEAFREMQRKLRREGMILPLDVDDENINANRPSVFIQKKPHFNQLQATTGAGGGAKHHPEVKLVRSGTAHAPLTKMKSMAYGENHMLSNSTPDVVADVDRSHDGGDADAERMELEYVSAGNNAETTITINGVVSSVDEADHHNLHVILPSNSSSPSHAVSHVGAPLHRPHSIIKHAPPSSHNGNLLHVQHQQYAHPVDGNHNPARFSTIMSQIDSGVAYVPRCRPKHARSASMSARGGSKSMFYAPQDVPRADDLIYEGASPDEKALVEACARMGVFFLGQVHEQPGVVAIKVRGEVGLRRYKILHTLEFDNSRRRMSVVVKRVYNKVDATGGPPSPSSNAVRPNSSASNASSVASSTVEFASSSHSPNAQKNSSHLDTITEVERESISRQPSRDSSHGGAGTPPRLISISPTSHVSPDSSFHSQKQLQLQLRQQLSGGNANTNQTSSHRDEILMLVKGADSGVLPIGVRGEVEQTSRHVDDYSMTGLRCLVIGYKTLSEADYCAMKAELGDAEQTLDANERDQRMSNIYRKWESNLHVLGATAVEDRLQDHVNQTLRDLRNAGIKVWVLTGDKLDTAVQIANACGHFERGMRELRLVGLSEKTGLRQKLMEIIQTIEGGGGGTLTGHHGGTLTGHGTIAGGGEIGTTSVRDAHHHVLHSSQSIPAYVDDIVHVVGHNSKPIVPFRGYWMVIDGVSLTCIFNDAELQQLLTRACLQCVAVLTCRCAPLQKAQVVRMIKDNKIMPRQPITAAIGDGANDVSMIQEAHVGIGIMGKEGRQAARSADFAMSRFHHLRRMLLVHGHWFYIRIAVLVNYFFYKNFAMVTPQLFYQFENGYSQQSLYDSFFLTFYNMLFSTLPILLFGLIEQRWSEYTLLRRPALYKVNARNCRLSWGQFIKWNSLGVWHAIVCYYGGRFLWTWVGGGVDVFGKGSDNASFGAFISIAVILVVNLRLALETRYWTIPTIGGFMFTFVIFFASSFLYTGFMWVPFVEHADFYYVFINVLGSPLLVLGLCVLTVASLLPDFVFVILERQQDDRAYRAARREGGGMTGRAGRFDAVDASSFGGLKGFGDTVVMQRTLTGGSMDSTSSTPISVPVENNNNVLMHADSATASAQSSASTVGGRMRIFRRLRRQEVLVPIVDTVMVDGIGGVVVTKLEPTPAGARAVVSGEELSEHRQLFPSLNPDKRSTSVYDGLAPGTSIHDAEPIVRGNVAAESTVSEQPNVDDKNAKRRGTAERTAASKAGVASKLSNPLSLTTRALRLGLGRKSATGYDVSAAPADSTAASPSPVPSNVSSKVSGGKKSKLASNSVNVVNESVTATETGQISLPARSTVPTEEPSQIHREITPGNDDTTASPALFPTGSNTPNSGSYDRKNERRQAREQQKRTAPGGRWQFS